MRCAYGARVFGACIRPAYSARVQQLRNCIPVGIHLNLIRTSDQESTDHSARFVEWKSRYVIIYHVVTSHSLTKWAVLEAIHFKPEACTVATWTCLTSNIISDFFFPFVTLSAFHKFRPAYFLTTPNSIIYTVSNWSKFARFVNWISQIFHETCLTESDLTESFRGSHRSVYHTCRFNSQCLVLPSVELMPWGKFTINLVFILIMATAFSIVLCRIEFKDWKTCPKRYSTWTPDCCTARKIARK